MSGEVSSRKALEVFSFRASPLSEQNASENATTIFFSLFPALLEILILVEMGAGGRGKREKSLLASAKATATERRVKACERELHRKG